MTRKRSIIHHQVHVRSRQPVPTNNEHKITHHNTHQRSAQPVSPSTAPVKLWAKNPSSPTRSSRNHPTHKKMNRSKALQADPEERRNPEKRHFSNNAFAESKRVEYRPMVKHVTPPKHEDTHIHHEKKHLHAADHSQDAVEHHERAHVAAPVIKAEAHHERAHVAPLTVDLN